MRFQRPEHTHPRDIIELPAITEPHQGTSYNPPVEAHTELILKAHEVEEKKAKEAEKMMAIKDRIGRGFVATRSIEDGVPEGMTVDEGAGDDVEGEAGGEEAPIAKKMPERKTKQQKAKAARLRAEVGYTHLIPLFFRTDSFATETSPPRKIPQKAHGTHALLHLHQVSTRP
jgi:nucleolar protein 53